MLAGVQDDQQVREFIILGFINEGCFWVFFETFVAVEFKDPKNDLRVDTSHSKSLHKTS